jgi:hypothetical protein
MCFGSGFKSFISKPMVNRLSTSELDTHCNLVMELADAPICTTMHTYLVDSFWLVFGRAT